MEIFEPYNSEKIETLIAKGNDIINTPSNDPFNQRVKACSCFRKVFLALNDEHPLKIEVGSSVVNLIYQMSLVKLLEQDLQIKLFRMLFETAAFILDRKYYHTCVQVLEDIFKRFYNFNEIMPIFEIGIVYLADIYICHRIMAVKYDSLKEFAKSIYHFRIAIRLASNDLEALSMITGAFLAFHTRGLEASAEKFLEDHASKYPNDPDINEKLAVIYIKTGKPKELVEAAFQKAFEFYDKSITSPNKTEFLSSINSNYAFFNDRIYEY